VILSSLNAADPDFYVPNWLYLGKSYYQLGKKEDARKWLKKAAEHQGNEVYHSISTLPQCRACSSI